MTGEFSRTDGRAANQLRPIEIELDYTKWAEGSVLISFGGTKVLCNATVEDRVAGWLKEQKPGTGWVTAEYSMLPRATDRRTQRESVRGRLGGRTHEISRLIGRALRGVVDAKKLGERTVTVDCDVLQADGGTRTASITGGWVALWIALEKTRRAGKIEMHPLKQHLAAVSLGILGERVLLDLAYEEDVQADTDMNLVMTEDGGIVEIQGTAEGMPFSKALLDEIILLGKEGIDDLVAAQKSALARVAR